MRALTVLAGLTSGTAWAQDVAPDFTLRDLDKQVVTLSELRGQVVLVDFWATWCEPCKEELPHLQKLQDELGPRGFRVLAVSTDDARTGAQVKPYFKRQGYTLTVPRDADSAVLVQYNPTKTLPFSVLLDGQGHIIARHAGFNDGDQDKLREEILRLLDAPKAPEAPTP